MVSLVSLHADAASQERVLRLIVVKSRAEAQEIHQQVQRGASFSALAYKRSIGPTSMQGGYSGVVKLEDMQEELRPVVQRLQPGQVSDVIKVGTQYILIKAIAPRIPEYYDQAERAWREGQVAQAVTVLRSALALEEDSIQTHMLLGVAYGKTGEFRRAFTHLEKAQREIPDSPQLIMLRGTIYTDAAIQQRKNSYAQQALHIYREVLRRHETLAPAAHFGLGRVYFAALKQPEKAIPHLEQAVAVAPKYREAYGMLIEAYYDMKRYDQAWKHLRLAQSRGYRFPKLLAALQKVQK
jgi:tetratricopeptide (TPR) repeat protein